MEGKRRRLTLQAAAAAVLLSQVAVLGGVAPAAGAEAAGRIAEIALSRGLDPEETASPLRISARVKEWARARIQGQETERARVVALLQALQYSKELDLEYREGHTGTAQEVFESGTYNCLSFSMLFVAMARELGLDAFFLNVRGVREYKRSGDLVILSRHVTAGFGGLTERTVLEFDVGPEINYRTAQRITDLEATALFFSNRGAELLRDRDAAAAVTKLEVAVALVPDLVQAWVNLGVARRRAGDMNGAEAAYRQAIELDKSNLSAYHNLAALLRIRQDHDAVGEILAVLERSRNFNPFTVLDLGDSSLRAGRVDDAERYYRRALRLARHEAETHAAMGQAALAAGRRAKARQWLERALEIDPQNERGQNLRRLLDRP